MLARTQKEVTTAAMRKLLELTRKYPLAADEAVDAVADKLLLDLAMVAPSAKDIEAHITQMSQRARQQLDAGAENFPW